MNTNRFVCFFRLLALLVGACLLVGLQTAGAQLNFTLQNPNPTVAPGSTFAFFATLTNTDPNNSIVLTGNNTNYSDPNTNDFSDNFLNTPPSLNPAGTSGSSWTGDLFDVTVPANSVSGTVYTGTYEIDFTDGGVPGSVTQNFSVTVGGHATTPEVGSVWGLLLLVGFGVLWRLGVRRGAGSLSRVGVALLCGVLLYGSGIGRAQAQNIEMDVLVHAFSAVDYNFIGTNPDGAQPSAGVIQGKDGALYGTTQYGGANGNGVVFKVNPDGSNFQVIHNFNYFDGAQPSAGVIQGKDGALYGTTYGGGDNGFGVVFKVNPDGSKFQVLHTFSYTDGANPYAGVIQGRDGALYGTTLSGGANFSGVVFKVNPDGSKFQVLYTFSTQDPLNGTNSDGAGPNGVIQGNDGALYGTTEAGGSNNYGVVFKVNPDGSKFQVLHSFYGGDGANPYAGVIEGKDGALYGTTYGGGDNGDGVVFKINTNGSNFQVLYSFDFMINDGSNVNAGVIQGSDGALYGTTEIGGAYDDGVVFKIDTNGYYHLIYNFSANNNSDGAGPNGVIQGNDGNLYGTTQSGGANGNGVIFRIGPQALFLNPNNAPAGSSNLTLTVLGNGFAQNDTLLWNGITIFPTSVSADGTQIQATIPTNFLPALGAATLQVQDPNINNTTSPLVFLIGWPVIRLYLRLQNVNNNLLATLTITNIGEAPATNLAVTSSVLTDSTGQKFNTSTSLPLLLGTLSPGGSFSATPGESVSATLVFPSTVASGPGLLQVRGTYGGGSFGGTFRVTVP
ncbi:MAG TPA: choice-of-anchor tandem repeat GloVer-containing protein [Chthonomonas sp.]|uniref:choice-of-anchor tandem repeat GloVer-containing protein n=1 Tax=Chthonomonas sp. TaxID=2282153 RepID=UPI002B4AFBBB|nr:choice-of-anchor tandem repeat GloVer-containing protein [Chthonomonas sp.]HLH79747.1 choice-of-anchor tandem repeat GloVer-containing protein [Chthonomonas sp.]